MEKESKQRKKYILSQTMEFDDSHCSAESDAGAGGGGGRVYAWGNGSELYFHWPVVVIYACTCIDEVGKLPWVLHHFRKYKWVKDLTRYTLYVNIQKYPGAITLRGIFM